MAFIGINGHLADAVCKTRVLVAREPDSVQVAITPHCLPLLEWLSLLPPVKQVLVDESSQSRDAWGEATTWTLPISIDTTYSRYPREWIVNAISAQLGLPALNRDSWFGVWRNVLTAPQSIDQRSIFLGIVPNTFELVNELCLIADRLNIVHWNHSLTLMQNLNAAAGCAIRIVSPGHIAQLMSTSGLECIVLHRSEWAGRIGELFCPPRARLCLPQHLTTVVRRELKHSNPGAVLLPRVAPSLTIGMGADLLRQHASEIVDSFLKQLSPKDKIATIGGANESRHEAVDLPTNEGALGISDSWNSFVTRAFTVDHSDWLLLLNNQSDFSLIRIDEIKVALEEAEARNQWLVTGPGNKGIVAISRSCADNIGPFDCHFSSAHFAVHDFHRRAVLLDPDRVESHGSFGPPTRRRRGTSQWKPALALYKDCQEKYIAKWGGDVGEERYFNPFNRITRPTSAAATAPLLVSIPTYHRLSHLIRAVDSLRGQTFEDFECWIVKDGCSRSASIVPRHCERPGLECEHCQRTVEWGYRLSCIDRRFHFFSLPVNAGDGWAARNFAFQNTSHPLITYLDDDNWLEVDHLEKLVNEIRRSKSEMVYTGTRIWQNGRVVGTRLNSGPPKFGGIDTSEILHTRELIERHGGWRDRYLCGNSDWDLVKRWLTSPLRWSHTGKVTLNYTLRANEKRSSPTQFSGVSS